MTRAEAKANGTEYYNAVSTMHAEEGEWEFETQRFDEDQSKLLPTLLSITLILYCS